jgi:predicted secreted acid phosphatase
MNFENLEHSCVTFDLDSTLANTYERAKRMIDKEKIHEMDWVAYAMASGEDPETNLVHLVKLFNHLGVRVVLVTYRPNKSRDVTMKWAASKGIEYEALVMSNDNDNRRPPDYKVEAVARVNEVWNVLMHFDDSAEVNEAIERELGIPTVTVSVYTAEQTLAYHAGA